MTIQEAAKNWGIEEKTVLEYIGKGYILNLSLEENQIILPDIPKPRVRSKPKDANACDKYIATALNRDEYVSYPILGITKERFEERLKALERDGYIFKKDTDCKDYTTTLNFALAAKGHKQFNLTVNINTNVKIAPQFGIVNSQIG